MPTRYFTKELPEMPLRLSNGVPLKFDLLATDDMNLLAELDSAIMRGVGGVAEVPKEEYDVLLKKKEQGSPQPQNQRGFPWAPSPLPNRPADHVVAADRSASNRVGVAAAAPEALRVPEFKTVKSGALTA